MYLPVKHLANEGILSVSVDLQRVEKSACFILNLKNEDKAQGAERMGLEYLQEGDSHKCNAQMLCQRGIQGRNAPQRYHSYGLT
jgi:hypothetical protein